MSTRPSGRLISTTSAHDPSPSAPISTSLKTQATYPPSVRERARKYPTAVAPQISRRSPYGRVCRLRPPTRLGLPAQDGLPRARRVCARRGRRRLLRGAHQHHRGLLVAAALLAAPAPRHLARQAAALSRLLPVRAQRAPTRQSPARSPRRRLSGASAKLLRHLARRRPRSGARGGAAVYGPRRKDACARSSTRWRAGRLLRSRAKSRSGGL